MDFVLTDSEAEEEFGDEEAGLEEARRLGAGRKAVEDSLRQPIFVEHFPLSTAGAPTKGHDLPTSAGHVGICQGNPYFPFASEMDWNVAYWSKLRGQGSTAVSDLLGLQGVSLWIIATCLHPSHCSSFRMPLIFLLRTHESSIELSIPSFPLDAPDFNMQKLSLMGNDSTSTIEMSLHVYELCFLTRTLLHTLYLLRNDITQMKLSNNGFTMTCTLENGGGPHR